MTSRLSAGIQDRAAKGPSRRSSSSWSWLLHRNHRAGPALALAPASYGLYMYTQLATTGEIARYAGNSERVFPLFWALITLCGAALVVAGTRLEMSSRAAPPAYRHGLVKASGWYLLVVAAFLTFGLHLGCATPGGMPQPARSTSPTRWCSGWSRSWTSPMSYRSWSASASGC